MSDRLIPAVLSARDDQAHMRSGGRVVEGARLESEYTAKPYRGFESLPLRQVSLILFDNIQFVTLVPITAPR
jgi:hypothetical protein